MFCVSFACQDGNISSSFGGELALASARLSVVLVPGPTSKAQRVGWAASVMGPVLAMLAVEKVVVVTNTGTRRHSTVEVSVSAFRSGWV